VTTTPHVEAGDGATVPVPATIAETLELVDGAWARFWHLASAFPPEHLDEPIDGGWTRKQMLAHIAAWHDHTSDRLVAYSKSGQPRELTSSVDALNAQAARIAVGRTIGEVLNWTEASFARLRRLISQLSDEQLTASDGWAAEMIACDCYRHHAEHASDLDVAADSGGISSAP
jgi:hypothetical protein